MCDDDVAALVVDNGAYPVDIQCIRGTCSLTSVIGRREIVEKVKKYEM